MTRVSQSIDRLDVIFDDPNLVSDAGLLLVATLSTRLGLEALINATVRLVGRVGGARPGHVLRTDGLLTSRRGSGTRVTHGVTAPRTGLGDRLDGERGGAIFRRLVRGPGDVISLARAAEPAHEPLREARRSAWRASCT